MKEDLVKLLLVTKVCFNQKDISFFSQNSEALALLFWSWPQSTVMEIAGILWGDKKTKEIALKTY